MDSRRVLTYEEKLRLQKIETVRKYITVANNGTGLGMLLAFSGTMMVFVPSLSQFLFYCFGLSVFHLLEFFITAHRQPLELRPNSYLINHSREFNFAIFAAVIEYWIEYFFFPSLKSFPYTFYLGVLAMVLGQSLRTTAMYQCGENFSHIVRDRRVDRHKLVTTGVYRLTRHPSYTGWFAWSVGTQVMLGNPLCLLLYTYMGWTFFNDRIRREEYALFEFFGEQYSDFHSRIPCGIPFVVTKNHYKLKQAASASNATASVVLNSQRDDKEA